MIITPWNNMGFAYDELEQYEKAIDCYETAVKYKPDDHVVWNNLGIAYRKLEQYQKAIDCYETAVKHKPDYHNAWNKYGLRLP